MTIYKLPVIPSILHPEFLQNAFKRPITIHYTYFHHLSLLSLSFSVSLDLEFSAFSFKRFHSKRTSVHVCVTKKLRNSFYFVLCALLPFISSEAEVNNTKWKITKLLYSLRKWIFYFVESEKRFVFKNFFIEKYWNN